MKNLIKMFCMVTVLVFLSSSAEAQHRTGVYINNQELDATTLYQLQMVTGPLYQGQYYIDQYGNFGVVGYQPSFNLVQLMQQQQQASQRYSQQYNQSGNYYRSNGHGVYGRDGSARFYHSNYSGAGITTDGDTHVITDLDGKVIDLPPY